MKGHRSPEAEGKVCIRIAGPPPGAVLIIGDLILSLGTRLSEDELRPTTIVYRWPSLLDTSIPVLSHGPAKVRNVWQKNCYF